MFLRLSLITAIFAACFGSIQAQSLDSLLSGSWVGELTQEPGGIALNYPFQLIIRVNGDKVSGQSYSKVYDDPNYAVMELKGTIFKEKLFIFQETKILDATVMEDFAWCLKGGQLKLTQKPDKLLLEGYWQGTTRETGNCIPGKIYLTKHLRP